MEAKELRELLDALGESPEDRYGPELIVRASNLMKQLAVQSNEFQLEAFNELIACIESPDTHPTQRHFCVVIAHWWAAESENPFLQIFYKGFKLGHAHSNFEAYNRDARHKSLSTRKAARGRKLIGWNTRKRIEDAAANLRHKSKEAVAYEISEAVGLSPGRVRQLLSEMYPGKKWHASNDS